MAAAVHAYLFLVWFYPITMAIPCRKGSLSFSLSHKMNVHRSLCEKGYDRLELYEYGNLCFTAPCSIEQNALVQAHSAALVDLLY